MGQVEFQETRRPMPQPFGVVALVIRALAVVDAVFVQAILLFWIWHWPGGRHGDLVGAVFSCALLWWAAKRAWRAAFAFDSYRWMSRHFVKLIVAALIVQAIIWLQKVF
ncbi:hypothetical protein AACH06_25650 [Ideonella sp. DXS29W]|uniref:Uncharacterized protein n=1 Tax=Ideonella lacteola TaxID=2984193 RepID=A0ABU9BW71_9BURK